MVSNTNVVRQIRQAMLNWRRWWFKKFERYFDEASTGKVEKGEADLHDDTDHYGANLILICDVRIANIDNELIRIL